MALYGSDGYCQCDLRSVRKFFNTFSTLYQAKDNDLLFAMPITERSVLTARLSGVYAMGLMYELFVLGSDMYSGLPTIIPSFIVLTIPMNLLKSRKRVRQRAPRFREFHLHSTKRNSSSLVGARWDIRFLRQLGEISQDHLQRK